MEYLLKILFLSKGNFFHRMSFKYSLIVKYFLNGVFVKISLLKVLFYGISYKGPIFMPPTKGSLLKEDLSYFIERFPKVIFDRSHFKVSPFRESHFIKHPLKVSHRSKPSQNTSFRRRPFQRTFSHESSSK